MFSKYLHLGLIALCPFLPFQPTQVAAQGSYPDANNPYKLSGTVENSLNGDPIVHALVEFAGNHALTDASGHFEFEDLHGEIQADVIAQKPGFFSADQLSSIHFGMRLIHGSRDAGPITIKLTPESVIYGTVESSGDALEGIPVELFESTIVRGRRAWQRRQAYTDDQGEFRIADLRPGDYVVSAGPSLDMSHLMLFRPDYDLGFVQSFHAGANDFAGATPIRLTAGQQMKIDFSLKEARAFQISGTVTGTAPGTPVSLRFTDAGQVHGFPVDLDSMNKFSAHAPAGSYLLRAEFQTQDGIAMTANLPLTVTSDISGLSLVLQPMQNLPVNVRMNKVTQEQTHQGRTMFNVSARDRVPVSVTLEKIDDPLNPRSFGASPLAANSAQLWFRNLEPGRYHFEAGVYGAWYIQSAACGDTNLLREDLEITGHEQSIDIVLRDDGANLNVIIGKPDEQIQGVILAVRDDPPNQVKTMTGQGQLMFSGLAPGGYNILAFDQVDQLEYLNPQALRPYFSRATHVDLQAEEKLDVHLELIHRNNE